MAFRRGRSYGRLFCACLVAAFFAIAVPNLSWADTSPQQRIVEVSVRQEMTQRDLLDAAEDLARQTIANSFRQDPALTDIEVLVLGNGNGEIIPILSTSVSRSQWQSDPEISLWSRYFTESTHALLQRDPPEQAGVSNGSSASRRPIIPVIGGAPVSVNSPGPVPLIRPSAVASRSPRRPSSDPRQPLSLEEVNQSNVSEWD
jgi:hypothetical protein